MSEDTRYLLTPHTIAQEILMLVDGNGFKYGEKHSAYMPFLCEDLKDTLDYFSRKYVSGIIGGLRLRADSHFKSCKHPASAELNGLCAKVGFSDTFDESISIMEVSVEMVDRRCRQ